MTLIRIPVLGFAIGGIQLVRAGVIIGQGTRAGSNPHVRFGGLGVC